MIATAVEGTQNQVLAPEESNKSSASLWNANTLDMKAAMLGEAHQPGAALQVQATLSRARDFVRSAVWAASSRSLADSWVQSFAVVLSRCGICSRN
jgi:hypothetical protein